MAASKPAPAFDPNGPAGDNTGIFGLPYDVLSADMVLIPVPWDVTVSYAAGTAKAPVAIEEASKQVDLFLADVPDAWKNAICMEEIPADLKKKSKKIRRLAEEYIDLLLTTPSATRNAEGKALVNLINAECAEMNEWVYAQASGHLNAGKMVGLIGGDHSTPFGFIKALADRHEFSILQIDAHCDLRKSYENFTWSHASVMYNALTLKNVKKLVQVGIRDWCEEEQQYIDASKGRVKTYFDEALKNAQYSGKTWDQQTTEIVKNLGDNVYISFDIDGLDPKLCPSTGTPVPGGLEFFQAVSLIKKVVESGRTIIGFDVVEVTPGKSDWDANVGARLIYQIANQVFVSAKNRNKKATTRKKK